MLVRSGSLIGRRATTSWSPVGLSWSLWLDPSDISTLWKDTSATSAVTAAGDVIARINDKSGNSRNFTQATASPRPIYRSSGGLSWIEYDGADDALSSGIALSNFITASAYEVIVGAQHNTLTAGNPWQTPSVLADAGGFFAAATGNSTSGIGAYNWDTTSDTVFRAYTAGNPYVWSQRHDAGNIVASLNNGTEGTTASGNTGTITGVLQLGRNSSSVSLTGKIFGVLISASVLSANDRAAAIRWMAAKSGVTL